MRFKVMRTQKNDVAVIYKVENEDDDFYKWRILSVFSIRKTMRRTEELTDFQFVVMQSFITPSAHPVARCNSFSEATNEMNAKIDKVIFTNAV